MARFPRYATAIALACVLGACSADEPNEKCDHPPKCICKPTLHVEFGSQPENTVICNNATFDWLVHTMLAEISAQKEHVSTQKNLIADLQEKLYIAHKNLNKLETMMGEHSGGMESLQEENAQLQAEVENLKQEHAKVHIRPRDCADVQKYGFHYSGIYTVYPHGMADGVEVFCDLNTDHGGWLVFQRRQDGFQNFNQNWETYKKGFGRIAKEFWLGNENLFKITSQRDYELRLDMTDFNGNRGYASYKTFSVLSERRKYKLRVANYSGDAGDALSHHDNIPFSTHDVDNDQSKSGHCSQLFGGGGWWFVRCYDSNLNGLYGKRHANKGIVWYQWHDDYDPLRYVEMKIRPAGF